MNITKEPFTHELFEEIMPLAQKLWDECSEIKQDSCAFHGERGFKIQPNFKQYLNIHHQGNLLTMVVRDDEGVLLGFSITILYHSLHHAPVKCAGIDTFYIEPEHRSTMTRLINEMEDQFRQLEVVVVGWPTSPDSKMFGILKLLGYAPDDVVMEKRICALQPH